MKDEAEAREQTRNARLRRDSRKAQAPKVATRVRVGQGGKGRHPHLGEAPPRPRARKEAGMRVGIYLESANFRSRGRFDYDYYKSVELAAIMGLLFLKSFASYHTPIILHFTIHLQYHSPQSHTSTAC